MLDRVNRDLARLQQTLGPGDRTRVAEYLDSVREVERRIQAAEDAERGRPRCRCRTGPSASRHASTST